MGNFLQKRSSSQKTSKFTNLRKKFKFKKIFPVPHMVIYRGIILIHEKITQNKISRSNQVSKILPIPYMVIHRGIIQIQTFKLNPKTQIQIKISKSSSKIYRCNSSYGHTPGNSPKAKFKSTRTTIDLIPYRIRRQPKF